MPPQALVWLLVFTACLSFAIGIGFALFGAWPVLPFIGLEVAVLATAFCAHARRLPAAALAGRLKRYRGGISS